MNNLLKKNIIIFFTKQNLIFILPLISIFLNLILIPKTELYLDIFFNTFGIGYNLNNIFSLTMFLTINFYNIWYCIYIYNYDFNYSPEMTFLRISKSKWLISKYMSLFMLNIFVIIIYLLVYCSLKMPINNSLIFYTVIIILLKFIIQLLVIMFYTIFNSKGIIIFTIIFLIPLFIKNTILDILYVNFYGTNNIYIFITIFIISIILCYKITLMFIHKNFNIRR